MRLPIALLGGLTACLSLCCTWTAMAQVDSRPSGSPGTNMIVVTLRPTAVVVQPIATLGAVATIEGGEPRLRAKIATLDIADVHADGRPVIVTREEIAFRIQLAGIDAQKFKVEGPAQIVIEINTVLHTEQEIVKTIKEALGRRFNTNINDLEIRLLEDVHLPAIDITSRDQVRYNLDTPPGAISSGKTRIDIGVILNGQRRGTVTALIEIALFRQVAVAARRLDAGETLQAESVRVERRIVGSNDQWLSYTDQLLGKRTVHTIAPGQTLTAGDLDLPPADDQVLIQTRDGVKLIAAIGNLRIIASGEAMQDGKAGQMIRVRNIESGRIVTGRVMARGMVEVDY